MVAPKTRSKPAKKAEAPLVAPSEPAPSAKRLASPDPHPAKILILPRKRCRDARIVTFRNPSTSAPNRYFWCPENGFFEFTDVRPPRKNCRSWLLASSKGSRDNVGSKATATQSGPPRPSGGAHSDGPEQYPLPNGYISKDPSMFVATPLDPLFIALPALAPKSIVTKDASKSLFLTADDYLDKLVEDDAHLRQILAHEPTRLRVEKRMASICDTVPAGEETMYRLSEGKLAGELLAKAERAIGKGMPPSIESRHVERVLDAPVIGVQRKPPALSISSTYVENEAAATPDGPPILSTSSTETSSFASTTAESQSSVSTAASSIGEDAVAPSEEVPTELTRLLRLRTAINFIVNSYIPLHLHDTVNGAITSSPQVDFKPLDAHLEYLKSVRAEVQALRSLSDNICRKRTAEDEEAEAEARELKKRKHEEEEKKKRQESKALRDLKKVDTSGMKKMSSFFTKVAAKK